MFIHLVFIFVTYADEEYGQATLQHNDIYM